MTIPAEQEATAALLAKITGAAARETQISAVFIGADTTFKLRKAVRLPFVDFSTLAERRRTARREVELNAPHAPGLYRGVRAVRRRADGTLALDTAAENDVAEIIDWVVEMASVPQRDFLDAIAERGTLDDPLLDAIADTVAAYHQKLPAVGRDQAAALRGVMAGNLASARAAGLPEGAVKAWNNGMRAALAARGSWLRGRTESGFVRRAHGDLHLGNLCLWQGRPAPFDALEFDEDLATIDVAYDLAFLLMDLERRAGRRAANRVLNRYIARAGDVGLVGGLPPFLSMRAMVRAHVEASRGNTDDSRAYLDIALACLEPAEPLLVAIGGLPGSGKSTIARAIAPVLGAAPGALVLRSDEFRKRRWRVAPEQRLPSEAYAPAESDQVFSDLIAAAATAIKLGHAVIADAMFLAEQQRRGVAQAAGGKIPFTGLWLTAPLDVLEARVAARRDDASDATVDVLRRVAASPNAGPPAGWTRIDATDRDGAVVAAMRALRQPREAC